MIRFERMTMTCDACGQRFVLVGESPTATHPLGDASYANTPTTNTTATRQP